MPGYVAPTVLAVHVTSTPFISEILKYPDHRQIASFFLGWVFICSLLCIMTSPVMRRLYRRCSRVFNLGRFTQSDTKFHHENSASCYNVEKSIETLLRDDQSSRVTFLEDDHRDLVLMLSICFAFASIGHFSSLLSFNSSSGPSACAFVVAWGGISAACGRLLGLTILNLNLRRFSLRRWEIYLSWSWLVVNGAFVFATYIINVGAVAYVLQLGTYLCYRTIYLPTALTMSMMFVTLELYMIGRLLSLIAPPFLEFKHRIGAVTDTRVLRALSLLLLELFCLVPGVKFIGIVGEFVPFSIGSLIVLAMFHKHRTKPILGEPMPVPPMSLAGSRPPTIRVSLLPSLSTQPHIPCHPFAAPIHSPSTSQMYRASIASSISLGGYNFYAASPSLKNEVVKTASRSRYSQSHAKLLDSAAIVSMVGHSGAVEEHTRTHSEPLPYGHILPKQVEFTNSLEPLQDLSSHGGLPIRPRIKITTPQSTQPRVAVSQPMSADSVAYGSDIIQPSNTSRSKVDVTKRPPRRSFGTLRSDGSFLSPLEITSPSIFHYRTKNNRQSIPVTPSDERSSCLEVQRDEWSALGHCNLSPTARKIFNDQSLQSSVPQTPTEQSVVSAPSSSIRFKRNTFEEQSFSIQNLTASQRFIRRLPSLTLQLEEKAVEDNSPIDPAIPAIVTNSSALPSTGGVRIRGPRPPPKVFSSANIAPDSNFLWCK